MATSCPINLDKRRLREEVELIYARVAADPSGEFHFHRGPKYAAEKLGSDAAELAQLPAAATASFAGVANPHAIDVIHPGVRSTGASVLSLFQNLFGLAAGPFIAGTLSDAIGLDAALALTPLACILAAMSFLVARHDYAGEHRSMTDQTMGPAVSALAA